MIARRAWLDRSVSPFRQYWPGDEIPDDHPKVRWLRATGAAGDDVSEPESVDEPVEPVVEETPEQGPEPEPESSEDRPRNAAPLDEWRKYAAAQGIDPKGLSKAELQAATK